MADSGEVVIEVEVEGSAKSVETVETSPAPVVSQSTDAQVPHSSSDVSDAEESPSVLVPAIDSDAIRKVSSHD